MESSFWNHPFGIILLESSFFLFRCSRQDNLNTHIKKHHGLSWRDAERITGISHKTGQPLDGETANQSEAETGHLAIRLHHGQPLDGVLRETANQSEAETGHQPIRLHRLDGVLRETANESEAETGHQLIRLHRLDGVLHETANQNEAVAGHQPIRLHRLEVEGDSVKLVVTAAETVLGPPGDWL